ncbi:MAG: hypothetical protein JWM04_1919 [Verrucomicrobiales bacterium]|nr:hypothetical protein [Verrucomicrobiales bacterium]
MFEADVVCDCADLVCSDFVTQGSFTGLWALNPVGIPVFGFAGSCEILKVVGMAIVSLMSRRKYNPALPFFSIPQVCGGCFPGWPFWFYIDFVVMSRRVETGVLYSLIYPAWTGFTDVFFRFFTGLKSSICCSFRKS